MIDRYLLGPQHRALAPLARRLAPHLTADAMTFFGFAVGLGGCVAIWAGAHGIGLAALILNRLADGLDGEIARANGTSPRGAFLDITLDFIFYALFPLAFALNDPAANALPAALLIASFMGTGASFLAFAGVAATQGRRADDYPQKGIPYLGGLTEGFETIAVFVAMCLWPAGFGWLACGFAAACAVTAVNRVVAGWRAFG